LKYKRWSLIIKKSCLIVLYFLALTLSVYGQTNVGMGPIEVRNQFPYTLRYLNISPDTPKTLPQNSYKFSYHLEVANTFIHTLGRLGDHISTEKVRRGLEESDFLKKLLPLDRPYNGFNAYIDVETNRHLFKMEVGLLSEMEIGIEWSLLSFGPGWMDYPIERFHNVVGVDNNEEDGGFRAKYERDRFDYYLIRRNKFILKEQTPFDFEPGDPTFEWKWNVHPGTHIIPSIAFKIAYKHPLDDASNYPRNLVSSGGIDRGVYYILAKSFFENQWVIYVQGGQTYLTIKDDGFVDHINHNLFTLEYQATFERSWLIQWARQSSIFSSNPAPLDGVDGQYIGEEGVQQVDFNFIDRGLAQPTDVLTVGVKQAIDSWIISTGFVEDINQARNEIDFAWFVIIEWKT